MKPSCGLLLFVFLLSFRIAFGQKENKSVLDIQITLEAENETVASLLEKISTQAHVFFSYDATLIEADKKITISITKKTIRETLDVLFESKLGYKTLGDQIIIARTEVEQVKPEAGITEENPKSISFNGKVIDREQKDVLPYTSISISGSNIGTISNIDGDFKLKIPGIMRHDTVIFSHLGYRQYRQPISKISTENYSVYLQPTSVLLKEIKVTVIDPQEILDKILSKIPFNYPRDPEIMTSFYREVLQQDEHYIDVSEALMQIRKAPYENTFSEDKIKFIKGRKSIDVQPFKFVDFKIQGGPYYITKLDVIKTVDSFLDPEYRDNYKYSLDDIVELDNRETYVIRFKPREKVEDLSYQGKLFVDMSSFALVQANFSVSRAGLKFARESLIKKKPKDFFVRPINVDYQVSYRRTSNKWHISHAQASVAFKVKSKKDQINSTFHSVSELLVTDIKPDDGTHFKRDELFNQKDIFSKIITSYDEAYWGDYNTIKPTEDLRKALQIYDQKNDTLFHTKVKDENSINQK